MTVTEGTTMKDDVENAVHYRMPDGFTECGEYVGAVLCVALEERVTCPVCIARASERKQRIR
jgi:hypothetical protein